uniref:Ig-like domain-containing protein n=1 Tax=Crocodylus porosus TaxID=8502 RepID=A0A7M4FY55_CROPO
LAWNSFILMVSLYLPLFTDGDAQELKQLQISITKQERKTAPIQCHVSGISLDSAYIHWYRQKPGKAPERILYLSSGKPVFDRDSDKGKFEAEKILSDSTCTLTIEQTSKDDAATYYCCADATKNLLSIQRSVSQPVGHDPKVGCKNI